MEHDVPESIWYCIYCDGISVVQERCHNIDQCRGQGLEERYYSKKFVSDAECSMYMQGVLDVDDSTKEVIQPARDLIEKWSEVFGVHGDIGEDSLLLAKEAWKVLNEIIREVYKE